MQKFRASTQTASPSPEPPRGSESELVSDLSNPTPTRMEWPHREFQTQYTCLRPLSKECRRGSPLEQSPPRTVYAHRHRTVLARHVLQHLRIVSSPSLVPLSIHPITGPAVPAPVPVDNHHLDKHSPYGATNQQRQCDGGDSATFVWNEVDL